MSLLPTEFSQFKEKAYWEKFFKNNSSFEWYGNLEDFGHILDDITSKDISILELGCGNSTFAAKLAGSGYKKVVAVDFSDTVIAQMQEKHKDIANLEFVKMDMMNTEFANGEFDVIIDKGAMDALISGDDEENIKNGNKLINEIGRILAPNGKYCCVTLCQEHIFDIMTSRAHSLDLVHVYDFDLLDSAMVPFLMVMQHKQETPNKIKAHFNTFMSFKFNKTKPNVHGFAEMGKEEVWQTMLEARHHHQSRLSVKEIRAGSTLSVDIADQSEKSKNKNARFTIYVCDYPRPTSEKINCVAVIVPQGMETEWQFSSEEGRSALARQVEVSRLIMVTLGRGHQFGAVAEVMKELEGTVADLTPQDFTSSVSIMTVSEDLGDRKIVAEGTSPLSGSYSVEDVSVKGELTRRLVFGARALQVQSECKLRNEPGRKKKKKRKIPDNRSLQFSFHSAFAASAMMVDNGEVLVVGLGGGCLPAFLNEQFPERFNVSGVELDPAMVRVASTNFGLRIKSLSGEYSEELNEVINLEEGVSKTDVVVGDGAAYLVETDRKFDCVCIDVDCKDAGSLLSCPPKEFLDESFLMHCREKLTEKGILAVNFGCRDTDMHAECLNRFKKLFPFVTLLNIDGDINNIILAFPNKPLNCKSSAQFIQHVSQKITDVIDTRKHKEWPGQEDIPEMMKSFEVLSGLIAGNKKKPKKKGGNKKRR
eukprot:TRINITY_DN22637_c0_g1_i1.p1 TRINITY_DN22637_c0_g1~~TRINITY_DN22637_c0_g1_i1.p1  ORF type:complete len:705 (-),score=237.46 TRINITY_DN22637_c0_g1_i1:214-2328(-)